MSDLTFQWCKGQRHKHRLYTLESQPTRFNSPRNPTFHHRKQVYTSPCCRPASFFPPLLRSAEAESIEFQKHWVHPSRKCAPNTALLWPAVTPGPRFVRGYQLEQRWPWSRPVGYPGQQLRVPVRENVADRYL